MPLSDLQKKYLAWDLTHKKSTGDDSRFTGVLSEARVDLNPHQVDAALFAFRSPLSKGAILADEVGLGKTIEAGIILSQFWAEHRRRILIIVPASLRNQWNLELMEKFYLPSTILVKQSYDDMTLLHQDPFEQDAIILCSYHFAAKHAGEIQTHQWDLVVLDEAHKLRNVYKKTNKIANTIRRAILPFKKILLTATPLQNNLNELYGLVSVIDQNYFASIDNFSDAYNAISTRDAGRFGELKQRLQGIIQRTLRRQVNEYVKYTRRTAMAQNFTLSKEEKELYDRVTKYLRQPFSFGVPDEIKPLMTTIIRKIMASSSYALSYTLGGIIKRLEDIQKGQNIMNALEAATEGEELPFEYEEVEEGELSSIDIPKDTKEAIKKEIFELKACKDIATRIPNESKAVALLKALKIGFENLEKVGAARKALIFTESCRTQRYLRDYLDNNGYAGKVVCFNGTNSSDEVKRIHSRWLDRYKGTARVTGDVNIDRKQALTDYFRDEADIMIATEAGAEGINLQFCSMVVNYDMPWNPQRIEQRIGRCHRYGQKHDVVVVNFVNQSNAADRRVYELLNTKFNLFEGVFGSSDEVIGTIEENIDFEKRLNLIYQTCRTEEEINKAFDDLQAALEDVIAARMKDTKSALLEHFDEDVIKKLKSREESDKNRINTYNRHLWNLTKAILGDSIRNLNEDDFSFDLVSPSPEIESGHYSILKNDDSLQIRVGSPIGQYVLAKAKEIALTPVSISFNLKNYPYRSASLEQFEGQSGYCVGYRINAVSEKDSEEELVILGVSEYGELTPDDFGAKLLELDALSESKAVVPEGVLSELNDAFSESLEKYKKDLSDRAQDYLNVEIDKLYAWADDNVYPLEEEVGKLRREMEAVRRASKKSYSPAERLELKKQETELRRQIAEKQRQCDELREEYDRKSEEQIAAMEKALENKVESSIAFILHWSIN